MSGVRGALLELVARGKKDVFFTSNPVMSVYHNVYTRASPTVKEIYIAKPRNIPEWGRWVDFDIDHRGDLLKQIYLRIELPTWLPSEADSANMRGVVTDASGVTFGYCTNVGFQVIDKIQVFNDQLLIHEVYGEFMDWYLRQSHASETIYTIADDIGWYDAQNPTQMARSVSRRHYRVPVPLLGWQQLDDPGLPLVALRNTRYRIRIHFRKLEDVVVASDGRLRPEPWGERPLRVQATRDGPVVDTFKTLRREAMRSLGVSLECTYMYVGADVITFLKSQTLRIPFKTVQHHTYTIDDTQLTAAAIRPADTFGMSLPIHFVGSVERMLVGFRSEACTMAGQRSVLVSPAQTPFIRSMRLTIANIDRIKSWAPDVFHDVAAYWKHARRNPNEIYTLTFGGADPARPVGTLNFTRASLPVLYLTLNAIPYDVRTISRTTYAIVYAESWNVYEISGGKGRLMFDD